MWRHAPHLAATNGMIAHCIRRFRKRAASFAILMLAGSVSVLTGTFGAEGATRPRCDSLEDARQSAVASVDLARIDALARAYVAECRTARGKDSISIAMAEIAYVDRVQKNFLPALSAAQSCINYHYPAVVCHAEKARALVGLRMLREASEVVSTGYSVAARARQQVEHDLQVAETLRSAGRPGEQWSRAQGAEWRLSIIGDGVDSLDDIRRQLQRLGGGPK